MSYKDDRTEDFTYRLVATSDRGRWQGEVIDEDENIVDVFRGETYNDVVRDILEEYPRARSLNEDEEEIE